MSDDKRKYMDGTSKESPDGGNGRGNSMEVPLRAGQLNPSKRPGITRYSG
jgi:hypothetical protein